MRRTVLTLACLAALAAMPAVAGAHGEEELGAAVAPTQGGTRVVGYGRLTTTRRHHRLYVRVCLQRWLGQGKWDTQGCSRTAVRNARNKTHTVGATCSRDGIYRVRVWGRTKSSSGKAGHRVQGKSQGYGIDCKAR